MKQAIRKVGTRANEIVYLERWMMMSEHPQTRDWLEGVRGEMETLKNLPFRIGDKSIEAEAKRILETCGLKLPETMEEQIECFLAIKTVVHYVERKLREIEENARWYYELLKRERDKGAEDND